MTHKKQIGNKIFVEKTTFEISIVGQDKPYMVTSSKIIFQNQMDIAEEEVRMEGALKQINIQFPSEDV